MKHLFLLLSTLFLFCSCGSSKKDVKPQELNLISDAEPKTLDSSRATGVYAANILGLTNEGLVGAEVDEKGVDKIIPAGAESWTTSPDGLVWTFKLRKNATWADGKPVTAKDYYYGITRALDPKTGSSYAFLLYPIKGAEEFNTNKGDIKNVGIKVKDDYTLEITLAHKTPYFLQLGYFKVMCPLREDIVKKYGEGYGSEGSQILSNGPYILKEWVHNSKITLEKNPKYWNAKEFKLDKINFLIVVDKDSQMNLIANGQVDLGKAEKPEWTTQFMKTGEFTELKRYELGTNYIVFNNTNKYFKNAKIRKAFSLAIDRDELNRIMYSGKLDVAYGFVSKGIAIGDKDYRSVVPEPLKKLKDENKDPKALLIEGLKELGMDPDPSKVTVTYLSNATDSWQRKYSELLQQMLKKKLGVDIKAEFVEWPVYLKRNQELDYDMGGQGWSADYNDPNTFLDMWMSNANIVPTGWKSPEYDALIKKAETTDNNDERIKYFSQAENILLYKESVISPLLYRIKNIYVRKYVKGYKPTTIAPYNFKGVYIEGDK